MSQALYRKWRPHRWDEVVGQDHVIQTLHNAVAANRVVHAYLFAGPRGTGKTTTARLLAKAVNCLDPDLSTRPCDQCEHCLAVNQGRFLDLIEIDAASNTSVDDVRDLREKINYSPNQGRFKVYIVDEVHMLSTAAFNALLKTLEEPPSHAIFILATTEVHKIPATVLSRCQRHEFRRISVSEIVTQLKTLAEGEAIQVDDEALSLVARQATGSMRDAISLLDQLASSGKPITLEMAQTVLGTATSQSVLEVIDALVARQSAVGLDAIHRALDAGSDPRQFARQIVDYLRSLLLVRMDNSAQVEATVEIHAQMEHHAQAFPIPELLRVIRAFNYAATDARAIWQPSLPLELAFVDSLETPATVVSSPSPITALSEEEPASKTLRHPRGASARPSARVAETQPADQPAVSSPPVVEPEVSMPPITTPSLEVATTTVSETVLPSDSSASQRLNENWSRILNLVRQRSPNTYGLLNSNRSRQLKGNVLTLGLASDVLKSQIEKNNHIVIIQDVLKQVVGTEILVRCVIVTGKQSTPPPDVDSDGMVASALRDLGGEIVDIQ